MSWSSPCRREQEFPVSLFSPGHETADDHEPDAGGNRDGGECAQRQHLDLAFSLRVHLALHWDFSMTTNARACRVVAGRRRELKEAGQEPRRAFRAQDGPTRRQSLHRARKPARAQQDLILSPSGPAADIDSTKSPGRCRGFKLLGRQAGSVLRDHRTTKAVIHT
jgi:hypothetical protein